MCLILSDHLPSLKEVNLGIQERNMSQKLWVMSVATSLTGLALVSCIAQDYLGMVLPKLGWAFLQKLTIKTTSHRYSHNPNSSKKCLN